MQCKNKRQFTSPSLATGYPKIKQGTELGKSVKAKTPRVKVASFSPAKSRMQNVSRHKASKTFNIRKLKKTQERV